MTKSTLQHSAQGVKPTLEYHGALIEVIMNHPELQGLRRWSLATRDAHALYAKFGFTALKDPSRFIQLHRPDIYKAAT